MSRLYLDSGLLSWNGNGIRGHEQIQKFIIDLPTSDHSLVTLDAQPILGIYIQKTFGFFFNRKFL